MYEFVLGSIYETKHTIVMEVVLGKTYSLTRNQVSNANLQLKMSRPPPVGPFPFPGKAFGAQKNRRGHFGTAQKQFRRNINRVPMGRHGLILRQRGAMASSMLFICVLRPCEVSLVYFRSVGSTIEIYPYFYMKVALSIFFKKERAAAVCRSNTRIPFLVSHL